MKTFATLITCFLAVLSLASAAEIPDITITELKKVMTTKKVILIDVNGSAAFAKGHIPTAIDYVPSKDKMKKLLANKDKGTLIVAYSSGPSCDLYKAGASTVQEMGFTNVKHLSAGITGWVVAGGRTEKSLSLKKD